MELDNEDFYRLEQIFSQALPANPNVHLWSQYLNYILRRNNLTTDTTGEARQTISQAYDFVLQTLGIDKDAGFIWKEYVNFLKSGPGTAGGPNWQDQQKMDSLRRAYRQAVCIPTQSTQELWTDYHKFETGLNKLTANKFMQDRTASFLAAKEAHIQLSNVTRNLYRDVLPRLPPQHGFEGDVEYEEQVEIWKEWIKWELHDPLVLRDEDSAGYVKRVIYIYKQATMTMPFEPEFWYEATEFCFTNNMETEGNTFLTQGIAANPESCLLAFKRADRIESTTVHEDGEEALKSRGATVREPYDKVIESLYALLKTTLDRQEKSIERIDESFAQRIPQSAIEKDDNEDEREEARKLLEAERDKQIKAIKIGCQIQVDLIRKTLSFAWIALMRAMRRVQGKGIVDASAPVGGSRQIFGQARKRGSITSDVYVASALMEHHCYKDPSAAKIFSRGMTLFPLDEMFALEYLKHLINISDSTSRFL
jgi:cleavage stimulation factor subunit 3